MNKGVRDRRGKHIRNDIIHLVFGCSRWLFAWRFKILPETLAFGQENVHASFNVRVSDFWAFVIWTSTNTNLWNNPLPHIHFKLGMLWAGGQLPSIWATCGPWVSMHMHPLPPMSTSLLSVHNFCLRWRKWKAKIMWVCFLSLMESICMINIRYRRPVPDGSKQCSSPDRWILVDTNFKIKTRV